MPFSQRTLVISANVPPFRGAGGQKQAETDRDSAMIIILFSAINFYYLAFTFKDQELIVSLYISEKYLFVVALNVGYDK
jgi:hypothetical protein